MTAASKISIWSNFESINVGNIRLRCIEFRHTHLNWSNLELINVFVMHCWPLVGPFWPYFGFRISTISRGEKSGLNIKSQSRQMAVIENNSSSFLLTGTDRCQTDFVFDLMRTSKSIHPNKSNTFFHCIHALLPLSRSHSHIYTLNSHILLLVWNSPLPRCVSLSTLATHMKVYAKYNTKYALFELLCGYKSKCKQQEKSISRNLALWRCLHFDLLFLFSF